MRSQIARDASEDLRGIVSGSSRSRSRSIGLAAAVRELAERTARAPGRRRSTVDVDDAGLGDSARSSLFQLIREALDQASDAGRPAASRSRSRRTAKGGVELVVSDDGAPERRQAVLDGLAERAEELNGTFETTRERDRTTIRIVLPPSAARV